MTLQSKGNGLALLAHKCAANTFDLSSGMVHASIRDQIVRAQLLIRDLKASDSQCKRLLVVGGGVAGVAAASIASDLGFEAVVVDGQPRPFSLQTLVSTRFVGPFMYEWPGEGHNAQHYPLQNMLGTPMAATPRWESEKPLPARDLAAKLSEWLASHSFGAVTPRFFFGADSEAVKTYVAAFVAHHGRLHNAMGSGPPTPHFVIPHNCTDRNGDTVAGGGDFQPDYIVLAAGMGKERVSLPGFSTVQGTRFWQNDDLRRYRTLNWNVGVFGGGDGALQDVLRLLTRHHHPLEFINRVESCATVRSAIDMHRGKLGALEQQSRIFATWNGVDSYEGIDHECEAIATQLARNCSVRDAVRRELRPGRGTVHHVLREARFGRAYLLNRFAVHLIEQCLRQHQPRDCVTYAPHRSTQVERATRKRLDQRRVYVVTLSDGATRHVLDRVVVRYGPIADTLPRAQMIRIHPQTQADRTSLSGIPLPFVVPQ